MQIPIIDNMHKPKPMMLPVFKNNFSQRRELGGKLLVNCGCGGLMVAGLSLWERLECQREYKIDTGTSGN
jgi:hypothetical protein